MSVENRMKLVDNFGRKHNYLRISLTEKFNLRCTYCMPEEGVPLTSKPHLMTAIEVFELARIFVDLGVTKIRLTGGEPLLRKDFPEIIEKLSELPVEVTLTTNALLVDRHLVALKTAGIKSLNVSLDTLRAERFKTITKRDEFRKTIENINLLVGEGFRVKVNAVVMKDFNENEIVDFVRWTVASPLHVRFIEFMPFDGNNWAWNRILSFRDILNLVEPEFEIHKLKDEHHDTAKAFKVNGSAGTFAIISSMTNHFCETCNRLRLTANGNLKNCLFSNQEVDLLTEHRTGRDLTDLIKKAVSEKHFKHGGIAELEKLNASSPAFSDRSMILIGG